MGDRPVSCKGILHSRFFVQDSELHKKWPVWAISCAKPLGVSKQAVHKKHAKRLREKYPGKEARK